MKKFIFILISIFASITIYGQQEPPDTILSIFEIDELVVTATKTERNPLEIPSRVSVISADILQYSPSMQLDDIIRFTPGVNVNRSTGIYSQRPMVTLRGLSGDEQARTLVLMNGVPINTSDEGGVNWNRINMHDIEKIEIFKGPGSSLYGNNAMGGVINLITKKPQKPQEVHSVVSYGTYNTVRQDLNVRLRTDEGYYGVLSQYYRQSDGFINIPDADRTPFDIARNLEELGVSARVGHDTRELFNWELQYDVFRDKRGEGQQIVTPEGTYRNFNTNLLRGTVKGERDGISYNFSAYYQMENYYDVNENMRGDNYSRFDVNSYREDKGVFANVNSQLSDNNTITAGVEYKSGSISGGDYYQTEPFDTVINEGRLTTFAGYIQNEHAFLENRIRFTAGLRFDHVTFSDGNYFSTDPWSTIPELTDNSWMAISPRAGARFNFIDNFSGYISYSHGFRASILDDLTRTGWMWVGPKYANPGLQPESIVNYETGIDYYPFSNMKVSASAFLMNGTDFLYYVETGDMIFGRPIYRRENVTDVQVKGFEAEMVYNIFNNLRVTGGYSYTDSRISRFDERPELENKYLKYVPKHNASLSLFWQNRIADISARAMYKAEQYGDDINERVLEEYITVDLMASRGLGERFTGSVEIHNVFDNTHMETINYISPGRLITGRIAFNLR